MRYCYPFLGKLISFPDCHCRLASLPDLAAMKLAAQAQRGSKKDFVDIYALSRLPVPFQQMVRWYQKKYATQDIAHILYSLVYFEDANRERMPAMLWQAD